MLFGVYLFIGQYLQLVLELTPLQAGFWTLPWALSFVVGSLLTPLLVRRMRRDDVVTGGLVLAAHRLCAADAAVRRSRGLAVVLVATVTLSLGLAPVFTLATDLVVGAAPPERAGVAAAISETCSEFGGAMGIADPRQHRHGRLPRRHRRRSGSLHTRRHAGSGPGKSRRRGSDGENHPENSRPPSRRWLARPSRKDCR